MWLIDVSTYSLKYVQDVSLVGKQYAILSHRWEEEEVTFRDINNHAEIDRVRQMKGWYKIAQCCNTAREEDLKYVWVDTCCIDKSSSAELQESINSMFRWYSEAKVCYVFLSDVSRRQQTQFAASQWFTRGWTLQELVAPEYLEFYNKDWELYGTRNQMKGVINEITGIPKEYLAGFNPQWVGESAICVAEIMSWAAGRKTTRVEDRAYSLIGLFGVSMPLLYGEGDKAFRRLQEELLRSRDDQSIFAWKRLEEPHELSTALADSPDNFTRPPVPYQWLSPSDFSRRKAHLVSNEGINIEMDLLSVRPGVYHAVINALLFNVKQSDEPSADEGPTHLPDILSVAFPVRQIDLDGRFVRSLARNEESLVYYPINQRLPHRRQVTLVNYLKRSEVATATQLDPPVFYFSEAVAKQWSIQHPDQFLRRSTDTITSLKVDAPTPEEASIFCSWNGWPHKLYWSLDTYPIQAITFGFDFDFNPVCLIVFGTIENQQRLVEALQHLMSITGRFADQPTNPESNVFPFKVEEGSYQLETTPNFKIDKPEDAMLILAVKSNKLKHATHGGIRVKVSFGQLYGEYYSGGSLQVNASRYDSTVPWNIDIVVESSPERKKYYHSRNFADTIRVDPYPARRLGTWSEVQAAEGPQSLTEGNAIISDDDLSIS